MSDDVRDELARLRELEQAVRRYCEALRAGLGKIRQHGVASHAFGAAADQSTAALKDMKRLAFPDEQP